MIYYYLEKKEPHENTFRYFRSELHINLLGDIQIDRVWGRLGASENFKAEIFPTLSEATDAFYAVRAIRLQRGYQSIEEAGFKREVRGMLPRAKYNLLNMEIASVVPGSVQLNHFRKNALRQDVVYLGDLVQLHDCDVAELLTAKNNKYYEAVGKPAHGSARLAVSMAEIRSILISLGLQLNSSIPGWIRPREITGSVHAKACVDQQQSDNVLLLDHFFRA